MLLRVIRSEPLTGAVNMAIDVNLAEKAARQETVTLRCYRWSEPTVTVGHTVSASESLASAILHPGAKLIRRPTGGGILFHGDQMSFSLSWPRGKISALKGLRESYCAIHAAVQEGLSNCSIHTTQIGKDESEPGLFCASSTEEGDLVSDSGSKVLGGAQWRLSDAVLYQGHIWLPWMPIVENEIIHHIGKKLNLSIEESELLPQEMAEAQQTCSRWEINKGG